MKKKLTAIVMTVLLATALTGCREAERVSYNVSKEADNFNVCRQITVINIRDDKVLYTLEGFFSLQNEGDNELVVLSEVGGGIYKKDFIYLCATCSSLKRRRTVLGETSTVN